MTWLCLSLLAWTSVQTTAPLSKTDEPPESPALEELLTGTEWQRYQSRERYRDRIDLFQRALERNAFLFERLFGEADYPTAREYLVNIRHLADFAVSEPVGEDGERDFRSNQVKRLEIRVRQMIEKINDFSRVAPIEHIEDFERTVDALEELRRLLLEHLFGDTLSGSPTDREGPVTVQPGFRHTFQPVASVATRPAAQGIVTRDRFTEQEFVRIQEAQDLVPRVRVFLDIAESRLQEISNRLNADSAHANDEDEEENPLEFFTYQDLVRAYHRALDGIMINIDEKATYKTARERDIRRALTELNKKIDEFIPRLEPVKKLAEEEQDKDLAQEVATALELSEIARKGSQYGLGAPAR